MKVQIMKFDARCIELLFMLPSSPCIFVLAKCRSRKSSYCHGQHERRIGLRLGVFSKTHNITGSFDDLTPEAISLTGECD